ncbi:MAG: hypothetical protein J6C96_11820 [Oscillospiraceae bacterium]|nr:hypothetical protein [Oscillospiraceae bacterium]
MRVQIGAPAVRPLTPNEQRVYNLLEQGLDPFDIARRLHMCFRASCLSNVHDVAPDTVMGLITLIREKGWDVPTKTVENKEEIEMPKGTKTPVEKIAEIKALREEGKAYSQITELAGVSHTTVSRVCAKVGIAEEKEEPAPAATDTSSERKELEKVFDNIIPENAPVVKHVFSQAAADAVYNNILASMHEMEQIDSEMQLLYKYIDHLNAKINALNDKYMYTSAELDRLWQDYDAICGGANNE